MVDESAAARTVAWEVHSGRETDNASTEVPCTVQEATSAIHRVDDERTYCWSRCKDRFVPVGKRCCSMSISQAVAAAAAVAVRPVSADSSRSLARSNSACPHLKYSLYCTTTAASRRGSTRSSLCKPSVAEWLSSSTPGPPVRLSPIRAICVCGEIRHSGPVGAPVCR